MQLDLDAVDDDQPDVIRIQAEQDGHILDRHRTVQDQRLPPLHIGQELAEQLDIHSHRFTYRVSKTESNSESGTSKTA